MYSREYRWWSDRYRMLVETVISDADGVQDVYFECSASVQALLDLKAGKQLPAIILDKGYVVTQENIKEYSSKIWGARIKHLGAARRPPRMTLCGNP